jgi:membrane-bound lytic murein transglycosylase D
VVVLGLLISGCASFGGLRESAVFPEQPTEADEVPDIDLPSDLYLDPMAAAEQHCEEGLLAYERGERDAALQHFQRSLALLLDSEPDPEMLYALRDLYRKEPVLEPGTPSETDLEPVFEPEPSAVKRVAPMEDQPVHEDNTNSFHVVMNEYVQREIDAYCGSHRALFAEGLTRCGIYLPLIREIVAHEGLPPELAYLPLVESNFKTNARSRAGAGGLWQFMPTTGMRYGLEIDWYVDERNDIEKSTYAAVRHLSNLYNLFGSWELALAAYNAGETTVWRSMLAGYDNDFWTMISTRPASRFLRDETKRYVPRFMAAASIAQEPEKYGFRPIVENPLQFEKKVIEGSVDLEEIAKACGVDLQTIKELNPELKLAYTPYRDGGYELKIPVGTGEKLEVALANMPVTKGVESFRHRVRRGETLSLIADRYGTSVRDIKLVNNLRSDLIRAGAYLMIPAGVKGSQRAIPPDAVKTEEKLLYTVKGGDTLWGISRAFGVSLDDLRRWNAGRLRGGDGRRLKPGDRIIVRVQASSGTRLASAQTGEMKHIVRRGDNLWDLSRKYRVSVNAIKERNSLRTSRIDPGDELIIPSR